MRHFRVLLALIIVCTHLVAGLPMFAVSPVVAQEGGSGNGTAVPVTDEEGVAVGTITVTNVVDPFTEFDPAYPPEEGGRYVAVNVAFEADAGNRFDISPYTIVLQDDAGFLWNQASMVLAEDALVPELSSQTLGPGSRITGVVGFVVPEGRVPVRVLYQPEISRIIPLQDLSGEEPPALGEAVSIVDSEGGTGSVTVTEVVDPFEDVDPTQTPPEDGRFVLVTLVYENTGDGRFFVEPYGLLLRDANGNLWRSTSVTRLEETELVPDITNAQLAPGDRLSGAVVFVVPDGVGLSGIYTSPVSAQLLQLADLEVAADDGATPIASTASVDESCAELERWLGDTRERLGRAAEISLHDAMLEDLEGLAAHVGEYAELAEAQLADQPPAEAEAVGKALVSTLRAYSGALEQILGANDLGNDVALELTEGMNTFNDASARLSEIEDELGRIAEECGLA
ncbi:MAG: DUF4352 domain-containing protein [Chloroflexi bacterium]|nr:DUF4352 domain-containing protein [Chloroflexota bacterium]